jgi:hypothetical protein
MAVLKRLFGEREQQEHSTCHFAEINNNDSTMSPSSEHSEESTASSYSLMQTAAILTDIKDTTMQDCSSSVDVEPPPFLLSTGKRVRFAEMTSTGSQPLSEATTHHASRRRRQSPPPSSGCSSLVDLQEQISRTEQKIASAAKLELQHLTRATQVRNKRYRWAQLYERLMQDLHERSSSRTSSNSTDDAEVVYTRMELPPTFPGEMKSTGILLDLSGGKGEE